MSKRALSYSVTALHHISLVATDRVKPSSSTSAIDGKIHVDFLKASWVLGHGLLGMVGVFAYFETSAVLVFLSLTAVTVCAGHSVGMHRLLIHRSFETPLILEYFLIWLGVLVGMAGPFGMVRAHDMRDWHQRQAICPPHPSHSAGFWKDAWWQLCCQFELASPPKFELETRLRNSLFYRVLNQTWMLQQLPLALILYGIGGVAWVLWGISLRIFVSLVGHWMIGHYAHRAGDQSWKIDGLQVQGYNLPGLGLITFGENWHGNHHAFPHSAQLGVESGQLDLGYALIASLKRAGLAWNVKLPESEPQRTGLTRVRQTPFSDVEQPRSKPDQISL